MILKRIFDERFLEYRRRSTSLAGIAGGVVAVGLFEYRLLLDHVWDWNLLVVAIAIAGTKLALMAWYAIRG